MKIPLLTMVTACAALGGLPVGALVRSQRQAAAPLPQEQIPAPPTVTMSQPSAPTISPARTRLNTLSSVTQPSAQMAMALEFSKLDSVSEVRELLLLADEFPAHSVSSLCKIILLKRFLEIAPSAAIQFCRQYQSEYLPKLIADYARLHPAEAREYTLELPSGDARTRAWMELCAQALSGDRDTAWGMLGESPMRDYGHSEKSLNALVARLVKLDIGDAMSRLEKLPTSLLRAARSAIVTQLLKTDPDQAWAWACKQPAPTPLLATAIQASILDTPAKSLSFLATLPVEQQLSLTKRYAAEWVSKNVSSLSAALAAEGNLPMQTKIAIASNALINSAIKDPGHIDSLVPWLAPGDLSQRLDRYLGRWTQSYPKNALQWIRTLPDGPFRKAAEASWNTYGPDAVVSKTKVQ